LTGRPARTGVDDLSHYQRNLVTLSSPFWR
jgi:hypothetical protein